MYIEQILNLTIDANIYYIPSNDTFFKVIIYKILKLVDK